MPFHWDLNYPPPGAHDFIVVDTNSDSVVSVIALSSLSDNNSDGLVNSPRAGMEENLERNVRITNQPNREMQTEGIPRGLSSASRFNGSSNSSVHGSNVNLTMKDAQESKKDTQSFELGEASNSVAKTTEITFRCPICLGTIVEETATKCGHIFCNRCITLAIEKQGKCPTCRRKMKKKDTHRVYLPKTNN